MEMNRSDKLHEIHELIRSYEKKHMGVNSRNNTSIANIIEIVTDSDNLTLEMMRDIEVLLEKIEMILQN